MGKIGLETKVFNEKTAKMLDQGGVTVMQRPFRWPSAAVHALLSTNPLLRVRTTAINPPINLDL